MVLLIDTNLIIDYIAEREQFKSAADKVFDAIFEDKAKGCLAAHSVTNMWYILRKVMSAEKDGIYFLHCLAVLTLSHWTKKN